MTIRQLICFVLAGLVSSSTIITAAPNPTSPNAGRSSDPAVADRKPRQQNERARPPRPKVSHWPSVDDHDRRGRRRRDPLRTTMHSQNRQFVSSSDQVYKDWQIVAKKKPTMRQVKEHIATIRVSMHNCGISIPPAVATDYEGGRVQHLRHNSIGPSQTPSPMAFAVATRDGNLEKLRLFGALVGENLRQLGFTVNFAPLVDLAIETSAPVIGTRSYSSETSAVQMMATKFAEGLVSEKIVPVLKHWPGLGGVLAGDDWDRDLDIHDFTEPMQLRWSISKYNFLYKSLLTTEPFASSAAVMSAHVIAEEYEDDCPGESNIISTCQKIVEERFRNDLDQQHRVLFSDDLAYLRALLWANGRSK